jgi:hypothetical protein
LNNLQKSVFELSKFTSWSTCLIAFYKADRQVDRL